MEEIYNIKKGLKSLNWFIRREIKEIRRGWGLILKKKNNSS